MGGGGFFSIKYFSILPGNVLVLMVFGLVPVGGGGLVFFSKVGCELVGSGVVGWVVVFFSIFVVFKSSIEFFSSVCGCGGRAVGGFVFSC